MDKVKLNKAQKTDLDKLCSGGFVPPHIAMERFMDMRDANYPHKESNAPLAQLSPEQVALSLCGWYEVEPQFKTKDWIYINEEGRHIPTMNPVQQIVSIPNQYNKPQLELDSGWFISADSKHIRHATESEIAAEKERRWWKRHNRGVWELKQRDIIRTILGSEESIAYVSGNKVVTRDTTLSIEELKKRYLVVCFAENRLDVNK